MHLKRTNDTVHTPRKRPRRGQVEFPNTYVNFMKPSTVQFTNYWDIMEDMSDQRKRFPLLKQKGGTCVIYSIESAKQLAIEDYRPDLVCNSKVTRDGTQMRNELRRLGAKNLVQNTDTTLQSKQRLVLDIIKALDKHVVVAGGNQGLPWDTPYGETMVPVFTYKREEPHNIVIIGYYNDEIYGPSFLTKMTNPRDSLDGVPDVQYRKTEYLSYGLLPIATILKKTGIVEFAKLERSYSLKF
jgi:hypothetical protein